ncbi:MAG: Stk1 family PASTA domain-containing Ser/Thr kinase [Lachnospiraceae bacterium]|jgi:serine/threonine-protein kinase|nr:Stk1 family PASTA domain-containing Ser/Thr kinase [Lachnospiraceae bacterium]
MLMPGEMLQERYEILKLIGSGGMAHVYKALCHKLDRAVAIKVLKEELCEDPAVVDKFRFEAQSAAKLSHPNIVNVYDVVDEGDLHYIVMEFVEGTTLKRYIKKRGMLGEKEAIEIALQVAGGIAAAHEHNIIHRDIKPQNILITKDNAVKVADFGIARVISSQTMNATVAGSVHYISPEQARGEYADVRSDIYSLGITMYEMVTGHVPFDGETTVAIALAHIETPIKSPKEYQDSISDGFEEIIYHCTEKKPAYRYADINQLISDLRRVLENPREPLHAARPLPTTDTIRFRKQEQELLAEAVKNSKGTGATRRNIGSVPGMGTKDAAAKGTSAKGRSKGGAKAPAVRRTASGDDGGFADVFLTILRVVAALLIIAVLVFVFWQLAEVLNLRGTSQQGAGLGQQVAANATQQTTETVSELETPNSKEVYVPNLAGLAEAEADEICEGLNLTMKVTREESDTVAKGLVIRQAETAESVIARYSDIHVVVSEGNGRIALADYVTLGSPLASQRTVLEAHKIVVQVAEVYDETVPKGNVIRYEPQEVKAGEQAVLFVSLGPAPVMVSVPDLSGISLEEARQQLAALHLAQGDVTEEHSDTVAAGMVIRNERASEQVEEGSGINLTVSLGPEATPMRYVGSIAETYNLSNVIGPGSHDTKVEIMIRLKQIVDGEEVYTTKMPPTTIEGNVLVPVNFKVIEGEPGVDTGWIEVVDVESGQVLKSYEVRFFPME